MFYEKLYKAKQYSEEDENWDFLNNESISKLNRCEKEMCDEEITENEFNTQVLINRKCTLLK